MAKPQERQRGHQARARYVIHADDRVVASISSVVGLTTALRDTKKHDADSDGAVSFAGVLEGAQWLRDWVESGDRRVIDVVEKDRQRRVRLHVSRLIDPLLTGETYEALVDRAETVADPDGAASDDA